MFLPAMDRNPFVLIFHNFKFRKKVIMHFIQNLNNSLIEARVENVNAKQYYQKYLDNSQKIKQARNIANIQCYSILIALKIKKVTYST